MQDKTTKSEMWTEQGQSKRVLDHRLLCLAADWADFWRFRLHVMMMKLQNRGVLREMKKRFLLENIKHLLENANHIRKYMKKHHF